MGGRSLNAQWECFPLLGNAAICYSGKAPASDRNRPRTQCLPALLAMLGHDRIDSISLMPVRRWPMSCSSLICTTRIVICLAARRALANTLSGAKSVRCINSWPQLLVRPLDSGRSLTFKVYLTSRLVWIARSLVNPRSVAFLLGPVGKATSRPTPCLAFLTSRFRRRAARSLNMRSQSAMQDRE